MRQILVLSLALLTHLSVQASDSILVLRSTSYSEVFKLAKKESKAVMLYFHFDGCGACIQMERTAFVDESVAAFYNTNFICLEVNTRKGEGIETNKTYNVRMHPTFLFLDENGKELHKVVGVFSPDSFLLQAKIALNPTSTLVYYKQQYKEGSRDADFLYDYCYKLRDAYELDSLLINGYLNTQSTDDLASEKNIKFIYEFAFHNGNSTLSINSKAFKFILDNRDQFYQYFEKDQVVSRIAWVVYSSIYEAINRQDEALFRQSIELYKPFDNGATYFFEEMDGSTTARISGNHLTLSSELAFYDRAGNVEAYNRTLEQFLEKAWDDYEALNDFAWRCYRKYDDTRKLKKAVECVERSIELNINYNNMDTYACLNYKLGNYGKALQQAEKAIELAKENDIDFGATSDLIERIKERQEE